MEASSGQITDTLLPIVVDPIVQTVGYRIFMLLMLPLVGLAAGAAALGLFSRGNFEIESVINGIT